tara:strand:+ start:2877 stop:4193 length:1317 start_codon:yes stop_codon:yes gene_type:complete
MKNNFIKYFGLSLFSLVLLVGCSLDTDNPNNLVEEDLDIRAFGPMVNGLEAVVVRAYGNILAPYSTASDEMVWSGSRDAWQQLNFGNIDNINNEFTNAAFFYVAEARYWSDAVIALGLEYSATNAWTSQNNADMTRAYMYAAISYMVIADMFDDFVIGSDKTVGAPAVGPTSMVSLYDQAVTYIDAGLALNAGLTGELKALKARTLFNKGVWGKTNPVNTASPLVSSAAAAALATEALAALTPDFQVTLNTSSSAPGTIGGLDIGGEVNDRKEMRLSDTYVISASLAPVATGDNDPATSITLNDIIDAIPDPALYKHVKAFTQAGLYPTYPIVSAREMHLILAEHALAGGDNSGFATHINNLRALEPSLTPFTSQVDETDLLLHSRRVNLFLQGRRVADHYRFGVPSEFWIPTSVAITAPGAFFPITIGEIESNPEVN